MKIKIISNCQHDLIRRAMSRMVLGAEVTSATIQTLRKSSDAVRECLADSATCDLVVVNPQAYAIFEKFGEKLECVRAIEFPGVTFAGFQPDSIYMRSPKIRRGRVESPVGMYHSRIAIAAYLAGRNEYETELLFNRYVYGRLGYFTAFQECAEALEADFRQYGIEIGDVIAKWARLCPFMRSFNHPILPFMWDVVRRMLETHSIPFRSLEPNPAARDRVANLDVYPVYPEIAEALGLEGDYSFRTPRPEYATLTLREFIARSFEIYRRHPRREIDVVASVTNAQRALPEFAIASRVATA